MSFCKVWPHACTLEKNSQVSESTQKERQPTDALVFPKQLIETTVEALIEDAFKHVEKEGNSQKGNDEEFIPVLPQVQKAKGELLKDKQQGKLISGRQKRADAETEEDTFHEVINIPRNRSKGFHDLTAVWASVGIMGFIFLILIWGILQRVQSLESWLHGRLMSRP